MSTFSLKASVVHKALAFDDDGNLYIAGSLRGRRGIVRISPEGEQAEIVVAGVNLVGLAFSASNEMADCLHRLSFQFTHANSWDTFIQVKTRVRRRVGPSFDRHFSEC